MRDEGLLFHQLIIPDSFQIIIRFQVRKDPLISDRPGYFRVTAVLHNLKPGQNDSVRSGKGKTQTQQQNKETGRLQQEYMDGFNKKGSRMRLKNVLKDIPLINNTYRYCKKQKKRWQNAAEFKKANSKQQLIRTGSPEAFQDLPLQVQWEITENCNFNCSYCFQRHKRKNLYCSVEQAKKAVEHIAAANRPAYQIYLLGGEALTHPNLIEIIKLLDDNLGEKIQVLRFLTNGSFKQGQFEEIVQTARHFPLLVSISVYILSSINRKESYALSKNMLMKRI